MMWTVRHSCPAEARFLFNCYKYWTQILLLQPEEPPVTLLIPEGITLGDTLSVVLYWITLVPLAEDLWAAVPGLLSPFYANDTEFDELEIRSAQLLNLLIERAADWVYLPWMA